jgi:hypothetical protein
MQFFLTDVALGFAALLGYRTLALLGRQRMQPASAARRGPAPVRAGLGPAGGRGLRKQSQPTDRRDLMVVDPKRLVRLW